MRILKAIPITVGLGLFLCSGLQAHEGDDKTKITFSGPVRLVRTQLPAGTYVFKLENTATRRVVQIFNSEETKTIATVLARPDYRVQPRGKRLVNFSETSENTEASGALPRHGIPVTEWFDPGDNFGTEFDFGSRSDFSPSFSVMALSAGTRAPGSRATVSMAESARPLSYQPALAPKQSWSAELPQTASQIPSVGLVGVLSLALAGFLKVLAARLSA